MYNKLFTKILDSSIWLAPDPTRLVWITLLAAMDEDGNAMFACVDNLAARARVTVEQAEIAIKAFESPDPKSGDPENDGIRVERIPGGWHLLNAHKYREMVTKAISREKTRERTARWRKAHAKAKESDASVTPSDGGVTKRDDRVTPSEAVSVSRSEADARKSAYGQDVKPKRRLSNELMNGYWNEFRAVYPAGCYPQHEWLAAERRFTALVDDHQEDPELIVGNAKAYYDQQACKASIGTQFVRSPARFLECDYWRGPFAKPLTKADARLAGNLSVLQDFVNGDSK